LQVFIRHTYYSQPRRNHNGKGPNVDATAEAVVKLNSNEET
jgi:hypothetical protein